MANRAGMPTDRAIPMTRAWKSVQLPRFASQAKRASPRPQPVPALSYRIIPTTFS
jgi:hypothetical protein